MHACVVINIGSNNAETWQDTPCSVYKFKFQQAGGSSVKLDSHHLYVFLFRFILSSSVRPSSIFLLLFFPISFTSPLLGSPSLQSASFLCSSVPWCTLSDLIMLSSIICLCVYVCNILCYCVPGGSTHCPRDCVLLLRPSQ